jgi:hypothetical protein
MMPLGGGRARAEAPDEPAAESLEGRAIVLDALEVGAEHELLVRCRRHGLLQRLGVAGSTRAAKFQGEISTICNNMHVRMADAFFLTQQGWSAVDVRARHAETDEALALLRELCENIQVLKEWRYTDDQCEWAQTRLGRLCGWRRQFVPLGGAQPVVPVGEIDPAIVDAPFLMAAMYLMVSSDFDMLSLAQMLVRASKGRWNRAGTVFTPLDVSHGLPPVRYKVDSSEGLGAVTFGLRGSSIAFMEFEHSWPATARRCGSNFTPTHLRLESAGLPSPNHHMVAVPETDMTFLTLAKHKWERRLGTLPTELSAILS